ncbi:MAG: hypothetical protein ACR2PL_10690, partial [Dehalococcoidia bacterium]
VSGGAARRRQDRERLLAKGAAAVEANGLPPGYHYGLGTTVGLGAGAGFVVADGDVDEVPAAGADKPVAVGF